MLFLIEVPAASSGPAIHFTICRGIELSMFGCVAREERCSAQRRKRGCKSRHIRLSSYPFSSYAQQNKPRALLLALCMILALLRLTLASWIWWLTNDQKRLFVEAFLMDVLFLYVFVKSLFSKTVTWAGIRYRVLPGGRMERVDLS